jgi:hypothetical protein
MMFWIREILGWLLIALGLYVFYIAMQILLLEGPRLLEAPLFVAIGFIVFRGGLHVLKVSVAGRVCTQAHRDGLAQEEIRRSGLPGTRKKLPPRRGQPAA